MADARPKTVQIFLPNGDARGVRVAEITSRTVQATQVPRKRLDAAAEREETRHVGVYVLVGDADGTSKPAAYVGEAENCLDRLRQHHRHKDFWDTAVTITSRARRFTKAHARYLEYACLRAAREAGRFRLRNDALPSEPHIPEATQAELRDNFGTIQTLLSVLGVPLLDPLTTDDAASQAVLRCTRGDADARGAYTEDGLVVLEGSVAAPDAVPSASEAVRRRRRQLREDGTLAERDGALVFTADHAFDAPSGARK